MVMFESFYGGFEGFHEGLLAVVDRFHDCFIE